MSLFPSHDPGNYNHHLIDTVRGANNGQNVLYSNLTNAEGATNSLTAFTSDGFTVGSNSSVNHNSNAIVGWTWDAGTSTSSNTDGTVNSNVRANQTAGFSIVTATLPNYYTNYTIGHGLNATPHFIIGKNRATANQWDVYHQDVGIGKLFRLNQTSAVSNATPNQDSYYPTSPTTSVFGFVGNNNTMNFVWYVFTEVAGYSSFGKYTGNGLADGPFVYTGFRPALIMAKLTSGNTDDWVMIDTTRSPYNAVDETLFPNSNTAEDTGSFYVDILSNGFKPRQTSNKWNGASNYEYVYAAFAEHPLKTARAR